MAGTIATPTVVRLEYDADSADGKGARSGTAFARHKFVEHVERPELVGDDRLDRLAAHAHRRAGRSIIDRWRRNIRSRSDGLAGAQPRCEGRSRSNARTQSRWPR